MACVPSSARDRPILHNIRLGPSEGSGHKIPVLIEAGWRETEPEARIMSLSFRQLRARIATIASRTGHSSRNVHAVKQNAGTQNVSRGKPLSEDRRGRNDEDFYQTARGFLSATCKCRPNGTVTTSNVSKT